MSVNKGKNWSKKEEVKLISLLKENKSYREISSSLKRTVGAIKTRRNKIAYDLFLEGQEDFVEIDILLDNICQSTRLTIPELETIIQKNNKTVSTSTEKESDVEYLKKEIMSLKTTLETLQIEIKKIQQNSYPHIIFSGIASQIMTMK